MYFKDETEFKSASGYDVEGTWYPRVTKIVEIKAKPALYRFYGELGSFADGEKIKEQSANEGTLVHQTAQELMLGRSPEIPASIAPAIAAFSDFVERRGIKIHPDFVERRIMNPIYRYAGTIDSLAWIDGKFGVLDIKTSYAIFRDYNLQTSAYLYALKPKLQEIQTRWILRIDQMKKCLLCGSTLRSKGGREKVRKVKGSDCGQHQWGEMEGVVELQEFPYFQGDFKAFLGAKALWEWENSFWLRKIGYLK